MICLLVSIAVFLIRSIQMQIRINVLKTAIPCSSKHEFAMTVIHICTIFQENPHSCSVIALYSSMEGSETFIEISLINITTPITEIETSVI